MSLLHGNAGKIWHCCSSILSNACNCWFCPDCTAGFAFLNPLVKDTRGLQICSPLALMLSKYVAQSSTFYFAVDPGQGEGCM